MNVQFVWSRIASQLSIQFVFLANSKDSSFISYLPVIFCLDIHGLSEERFD